LAISTDFTATLGHWKKELGATYPMLSDHMRKVSEQYGVLITQLGLANRATFVIDKDGKIASIDKAVKPATSAEDMIAKLAELKVPKAH